MAVVASSQIWSRSSSVLPFVDFSLFFQAAAIPAKQEARITAPLLGSEQFGAVLVETNSESANTEKSCSRDGGDDGSCSEDDLSTSSRSEAEEDCRSDLGTSELKRIFEKFDENQDEFICAADLHRFMKRLGFEICEEEAVSLLATVDHDGDGKVGFEEFYTLYRSLDEGNEPAGETGIDDEEDDTLLEAFRVFDKNNDGFITSQELQTVLLALGLPEGQSLKSCELMIQAVDSDGNGEVDINEFKQMMSVEFLHEMR